MKKYLVTTIIMALTANAIASQVRFDALQGARTTKQDFVEMFVQPSVMWSGEINDQVLYENGTGGFIMSHDNESKYGIYFGRQPRAVNEWQAIGTPFNAAPFNSIDTPIHFFYGRDMGGFKWALNLHYANSKKESNPNPNEKSATALAFGVNGDGWRADLAYGLSARVTNTNDNKKAEATGDYRLQAEYDITNDLRAYVDLSNLEVVGFDPTESKRAVSEQSLGIERRTGKDNSTFFYGVKYQQRKVTSTTDSEKSLLPLYAGFEAEATSWLVLRGAISQPVLVGTEKTGNNTDTLVGGPTYTAGAGLRLGNILLDGAIQLGDSNNNDLTSINLMSQVAVTYNF